MGACASCALDILDVPRSCCHSLEDLVFRRSHAGTDEPLLVGAVAATAVAITHLFVIVSMPVMGSTILSMEVAVLTVMVAMLAMELIVVAVVVMAVPAFAFLAMMAAVPLVGAGAMSMVVAMAIFSLFAVMMVVMVVFVAAAIAVVVAMVPVIAVMVVVAICRASMLMAVLLQVLRLMRRRVDFGAGGRVDVLVWSHMSDPLLSCFSVCQQRLGCGGRLLPDCMVPC